MFGFLDASILGAAINPTPKSAEVKSIQSWAASVQAAGHVLIVPAIADYEIRRECERRNATVAINALNDFIASAPDRYLPLTDSALKLATTLWADVRKRGLPTADAKSLDCDIILAAQILDLSLPTGTFTVVTTNVAHLSRVIACKEWKDFPP